MVVMLIALVTMTVVVVVVVIMVVMTMTVVVVVVMMDVMMVVTAVVVYTPRRFGGDNDIASVVRYVVVPAGKPLPGLLQRTTERSEKR